MVQVDKRSHLVLFKQNQRNRDPYTSELQKAYKTDYLANRHNMMGTVSKLYVSNNTWIYVYIKKLYKISTPIPTPESFNSNSNSNSGSFNSNSNSNSGKSLEYQLQLQLQLQEFQLQFQLQLRPISRISTPTPTPTPEVSTPIPTPTPELELELNPTPTPTPELTPPLTPGFNGLDKDNCKTRRQPFKFGIWCAYIIGLVVRIFVGPGLNGLGTLYRVD